MANDRRGSREIRDEIENIRGMLNSPAQRFHWGLTVPELRSQLHGLIETYEAKREDERKATLARRAARDGATDLEAAHDAHLDALCAANPHM